MFNGKFVKVKNMSINPNFIVVFNENPDGSISVHTNNGVTYKVDSKDAPVFLEQIEKESKPINALLDMIPKMSEVGQKYFIKLSELLDREQVIYSEDDKNIPGTPLYKIPGTPLSKMDIFKMIVQGEEDHVKNHAARKKWLTYAQKLIAKYDGKELTPEQEKEIEEHRNVKYWEQPQPDTKEEDTPTPPAE